MSLWRRTRTEVAGAWRSLRYDLGRRAEPASGPAPAPDVTSTGMSTFGGVPAADLRTAHDGYARPPRRVAAVAAFGVLAVVGAAGSYFAVVNGLGAALGEKPASAGAYPLAVTVPPRDTADEADSVSGMGRGSAPRTAATTGAAAVAVPSRTAALPGTAPAPARPAPARTRDAQPGTPDQPDCDCLTPPVPTPTAPPAPSPTPSAGGSPEPTPSGSSGTPSEEPPAEPSATGDGPHPERHRRPAR